MPSQAPSSLATTFGLNVQAARKAKRLTQRALADRVGVDPMVISKWERGLHRPSDENLEALSRELERSVAWLYTEHDETVAA